MTKLTIIGSGNWANDRGQPAFLLTSDGADVLVDCGAGTLQQLRKFSIHPRDVQAIVLTHFHWDHMGDVLNFALMRWAYAKRGERHPYPLRVVGPPGLTMRFKELLTASGAEDLLAQEVVDISSVIIPPTAHRGARMEIGPFVFQAFTVRHSSDMVCLCWRVELPQTKAIVAFGGDAGPDQAGRGFTTCLQRAEVAIIEAGTAEPSSSHLTAEQAIEFAKRAGVRNLILNHLDHPLRDRANDLINTNYRACQESFDSIQTAVDGDNIDNL